MKPQALQDAIKLKAQKRAENWKEPEVKKHQMTKEEYEAIQKRKTMSPMQRALGGSTGVDVAPPINMSVIQGMLDKHRFEMKQEMNKVVEAMKSVSVGSNDEAPAAAPTKGDNNEVISLIQELKAEISSLRETIKELSGENSAVVDLKDDIASLRKEIQELKETGLSSNSQSTTVMDPVTPVAIPKPKVSAPATPRTPGMDREERRKKQMEPHGVERLYEAQRRDDLIKEFIQERTGPYTEAESKIKTIEGRNLVFFRKKIYIPKKLRKDTIHHYCNEYATNEEALEALQELCIWPDLEADFKRFKLGW